jgi:predicted glycosyltransferase
MNILIEIGHPAHVHFFKGVVRRLELAGDKVVLVTRNKEITDRLLDDMGFAYTSLSTPATGKARMLGELLLRWLAIWRLLGREKIEVACSISGISTALPACLRRVPNLTVTDTEDARLSNLLAFPFSSYILTPDFFLHDLGAKQVRHDSLHELAYLRDFLFEGLDQRLAELGLERPYSFIRLIGFDAAHDWSITAESEEEVQRAVESLEKLGTVYIHSQRPLPPSLAGRELHTPITRVHDVLAGASLFMGESPTMAVEAGLLGTPAFLVSPRAAHLGNMVHLERLGLLKNFDDWTSACEHMRSIDDPAAYRGQWRQRAQDFRAKTIDINQFMVEAIQGVSQGRRPGAKT